MVAGKPNTPVAPPYEEYFEFKADSTFVRHRYNGYRATGTYSIQPSDGNTYAVIAKFDNKELSYHEISGEKQYAYIEGQVYLQQTAPDKLVESYMASDGDSFVYQKVTDKD
jgi:antibiotic biosynthesis monooxygenase (ABM) superfamily enzyme